MIFVMIEKDKFYNSIDLSKVRITETSKLPGISKHSKILTSINGDSEKVKKLYKSPHFHTEEYNEPNLGISISNIDEGVSFLNLKPSLEEFTIIRNKDFLQTIKLIFDDGEFICSPYTLLNLSECEQIYAKDVKSFSSILGYDIYDGKLRIVSKYVKAIEEHSFLDYSYQIKSTYGNVGIALNDKAGIFIATSKDQ